MKVLITLGCEGNQQDGFHFCNGVENVILDLEQVKLTENYFDLIKYLDGTVGIFDNQCGKQNIVSNAVYKIYELGYISEKTHQFIAYFYNIHRRCNLLLSCRLKESP